MSAIAVSKYIIILSCLGLVACAPSREFNATPQPGANRSGDYPRFSDRPQAQTASLTPSESRSLTEALDQEKQAAKALALSPGRNATLSNEAIRREVEETLKAIEQGNQS